MTRTITSRRAFWEIVVTRGVVPAWILTGALFKLIENSPASLPAVVVKWLGGLGINLGFALHAAVAAELMAVGIIWLVPRLARLAALAMLGLFMPVLIGDVVTGAASCGCFGSVRVHPLITLLVDGTLFVAVLVAGRRAESLRWSSQLPSRQVVAALVWTIAAFIVAFGYPFHGAAVPASGAKGTPAAAQGSTSRNAPPSYYLPHYASWVGRPWDQVDLATWIRPRIQVKKTGVQYIILYRKDCEHCHHLLQRYFSGALSAPTTVVAIPDKKGFPTQGVLPMPCTECSRAELPSGCDWFFSTPVMIRLRNGIVECAAEVDPDAPACLER
ncbi:MAG: hypothetical protein GXP48_00755 [Acidobacteria bacterium]|nr:hypothetical protein [Acidobacteriota bacterium]